MNRRQCKRNSPHGDDVDNRHRVIVLSEDDWKVDESLSLDYPVTMMTSSHEGSQGVLMYISATQNHDLLSTIRRPQSLKNDKPLQSGEETDDGSQRRNLGEFSRLSSRDEKERCPSTMHSNPAIPKSNDNDGKEQFGRLKHLRNSMNKLRKKGQKKLERDALSSRPFFRKLKRFWILRRRENAPVCDEFSGDTIRSSLKHGEIPEYVVTNLTSLGSIGGEATKGTPSRRKLGLKKFRQTETPKKECVDIWSEISSLGGGSYHAGLESIDFDDRTITSDESGSLFDDIIDALDDFANLRFLGVGYECGMYEIPTGDVNKCTFVG